MGTGKCMDMLNLYKCLPKGDHELINKEADHNYLTEPRAMKFVLAAPCSFPDSNLGSGDIMFVVRTMNIVSRPTYAEVGNHNLATTPLHRPSDQGSVIYIVIVQHMSCHCPKIQMDLYQLVLTCLPVDIDCIAHITRAEICDVWMMAFTYIRFTSTALDSIPLGLQLLYKDKRNRFVTQYIATPPETFSSSICEGKWFGQCYCFQEGIPCC